jgi:hypothetical protein
MKTTTLLFILIAVIVAISFSCFLIAIVKFYLKEYQISLKLKKFFNPFVEKLKGIYNYFTPKNIEIEGSIIDLRKENYSCLIEGTESNNYKSQYVVDVKYCIDIKDNSGKKIELKIPEESFIELKNNLEKDSSITVLNPITNLFIQLLKLLKVRKILLRVKKYDFKNEFIFSSFRLL